jgi:phosphatidylserine/phosphatidylglycerophosphate/cardiolipin synthase-like enzyme
MCSLRPVSLASLVWARGLLGPDGEQVVGAALLEHGASLDGEVLDALPVCSLLAFLAAVAISAVGAVPRGRRVVWTLPADIERALGSESSTYLPVAIELINSAKSRLLLVSPYLERKGVGLLTMALLSALHRGVETIVLTHGVSQLNSQAAAAVEELRREALGRPGSLTIYSSREDAVLLHPKIIVVDGMAAVVGSANLTGAGMTRNFEAGVVLGPLEAQEIERIVLGAIARGVAELSFSIVPPGSTRS